MGSDNAHASVLWDTLRKDARRLEAEADGKLGAASKLVGGSGAHDGDEAEARLDELDALLARIADVSEAMQAAVGSAGDARSHVAARHRDRLAEHRQARVLTCKATHSCCSHVAFLYETQELRRLRASSTASREHAALLGTRRGGGDASLHGVTVVPGGATASSSLMRERAGLASGSSQLDDVLGQAHASAAQLAAQRSLFGEMGAKMSTLGARFPALNSAVTEIRRKRSRDSIILASVVGGCTLLLLVFR